MSSEDYMRLPGAWDVRHWIRIPALSHEADGRRIEDELGRLEGIRVVQVYVSRRKVRVMYDQSKMDYRSIKDRLEAIGFPIASNWWCNQKGYWFQYLDCNARENANAPSAPCCNKPRGIKPLSNYHKRSESKK